MNIHTKIYILFGVCAVVLVGWCMLKPATVGNGSLPPQDVRTTGEIVAVGRDNVTIAVLSYGRGMEPIKVGNKTFAVTAATNISTQILRDRAVVEAELKEFQEKLKIFSAQNPGSSTPPVAPIPFTEKTLLLSELKSGTLVTITPEISDPARAASILVTTPPPVPATPPAPVPAPAPKP